MWLVPGVGPGLGCIPALINNSWTKQAGVCWPSLKNIFWLVEERRPSSCTERSRWKTLLRVRSQLHRVKALPRPRLNKTPPKINPEEVFLTRKSRTELARLRSGFSRTLNSYLSRVDPDTPDNCPKCTQSPHNSIHLFSCPSNPTHLTVESLWTKPKEAAEFLKLDELEEWQPTSIGWG